MNNLSEDISYNCDDVFYNKSSTIQRTSWVTLATKYKKKERLKMHTQNTCENCWTTILLQKATQCTKKSLEKA